MLKFFSKPASYVSTSPTDKDVNDSNQKVLDQMKKSQIQSNNTTIAMSQANEETAKNNAISNSNTQKIKSDSDNAINLSNGMLGSLGKMSIN